MNVEFGYIPDKNLVFVPKGWGWESWIHNSEKYCGKILFIKKGKKLSFHYHKIKEETFLVNSGKILVYYGWDDDFNVAKKVILKKGDVFHVPPDLRHRMKAIQDTYLVEFSTQHFDEDSIRIVKGD